MQDAHSESPVNFWRFVRTIERVPHGFEEQPATRLWGLLARDGPVGVVLRRGPSKQVLMIKWDTENEKFETDHWFKGRVYEKRPDLSPAGKLPTYFAANQKPQLLSWTALNGTAAFHRSRSFAKRRLRERRRLFCERSQNRSITLTPEQIAAFAEWGARRLRIIYLSLKFGISYCHEASPTEDHFA